MYPKDAPQSGRVGMHKYKNIHVYLIYFFHNKVWLCKRSYSLVSIITFIEALTKLVT